MLALTNENDVVYDPFAGVGSTLLAALKNNRRAFGTELMQEYIDIGLERIKALSKDELKTRPIYQRIYEPSGNDTISKYPVEWMEKRLEELENIEKALKTEKSDIKKEIKNRNKE